MKKPLQQLSIIIALFSSLIFSHQSANAQIPSACFEIQSILVAACGTPEGENEMVRFIIGPNDLPVSLLTVQWPNASNSFLGICQNAQTAAKVDTINSSIANCGYVMEPVGGVLPAGSTVILVTSTNMDPVDNSFAGLTDTLIMIFQCAGNTSGHFKNYGTTGNLTRTLVMTVDACIDSVTYHIDSLTKQNGTIGDENGATVLFDFPGNPSYINPGCEAPFNAVYATLSTDSTGVCAGDSVHVSATISNNNFSSYYWSGGNGTYANASSLTTTYQTSTTFHGNDSLVFVIVGNCNDTIYKTLPVLINPCSIGIKEYGIENNVSVFPNPVANQCHITAKGFINSIISIYDVAGRIIIKQNFNEKETINVSGLKTGIYMLEVKDEKGMSVNGKLTKI